MGDASEIVEKPGPEVLPAKQGVGSMGSWKTVVWATGILAATGIGAEVGPRAEGQAKTAAVRQAKPAIVQVLAGTGSWIGVSVRDVVADDVSKMKLQGPEGVVVEEVTRESPAETAGLKAGDVIVEFDGDRVRSTRQFTRLVQETPAGRKVQASVLRDGQRVPLTIEPQPFGKGHYFDGEFPQFAKDWFVPPVPPAPPAPAAPPAAPAPPVPPAFRGFFDFDELIGRGSGRLGLSVSDLQPQLADYFGVNDGVLVTSVTSDSPASKAGVKAGDVITTLNGSSVSSPSDLRTRASRLRDGEEFSIGVTRDKKSLTLKGKAEEMAPRHRTVL
jgi:serine protease Do